MYSMSFEVGTALPLPVQYSERTAIATAVLIVVQWVLIKTQLVQCDAPSQASTRLAAVCRLRQTYS